MFGKIKNEHDKRLINVLNRLKSTRITLKRPKCEFNRSSVLFLRHTNEGLRVDPTTNQEIKRSTNLTELQRFMKISNLLDNFSPHLAQLIQL